MLGVGQVNSSSSRAGVELVSPARQSVSQPSLATYELPAPLGCRSFATKLCTSVPRTTVTKVRFSPQLILVLQNITDISFTTRLHWCRFRSSPAGWWRAWTAGWCCSPSRSCSASRSSRRTAGMLRRRFLSLRRRKSARMCSTWSVSRSPQLLLTDKILLNCRLKRGSQLRFAPARNSTRKRSPYTIPQRF